MPYGTGVTSYPSRPVSSARLFRTLDGRRDRDSAVRTTRYILDRHVNGKQDRSVELFG